MRILAPVYTIENVSYEVPVLIGAEEELIRRRELRVKYETNRDIKVWSTWFLLKRISSNSSHIQHWIRQREFILSFLQCNENTFRRHLKELVRQKLATVDSGYNITLTSYQKAAAILGIAWSGTSTIFYNPTVYEGKQTFRYLLVAQEMRNRQELQLRALLFHLDKNPTLKTDILLQLERFGASAERLVTDAGYFQERLLQLQLQLFRQGSEILGYIFTHRADINRGVRCIQKHHTYKGVSSVSYLKKCMQTAGVITVNKPRPAVSESRSRLYIPAEAGGKREAYKWLPAQKKTALFITDQITFNHGIFPETRTAAAEKKAA